MPISSMHNPKPKLNTHATRDRAQRLVKAIASTNSGLWSETKNLFSDLKNNEQNLLYERGIAFPLILVKLSISVLER